MQHTQRDAAYWVAKLHSDQASAADREEFHAWCAEDPTNAAEFEEVLNIWKGFGGLSGNRDARLVLSFPTKPKPLLQRRQWLGLTGAAAAAGLLWTAPRLTIERRAYHAGRGERKSFTLDDGSVLTLNTDSEVAVAFAKSERCVFLQKGQCFVDVAKDKSRPFRVFVGTHEIRALGTAFDVYYDARGAIHLTMSEGTVGVYPGSVKQDLSVYDAVLGTALGGEAAATIVGAGHRALLQTAHEIEVSPADLRTAEAWRAGKVIFDETRLSDAVSDVNRYLDRPIVLMDPAIGQLRVSGVFQIAHLTQFPDTIARTLNLRVNSDRAVIQLQP